MPAFVNSKLGEDGMSEAEGTTVCRFSQKKSRNDWRMDCEVMSVRSEPPESLLVNVGLTYGCANRPVS